MNLKKIKSLDFIMLSNFDRSEGGRETWAYGFLPDLMKSNPELQINLFALTPKGKNDNENEIKKAVGALNHHRLKTLFFEVKWPQAPWFFSMILQMRAYVKKKSPSPPQIVLGVGGLFEVLCLLYSGNYKKSKKIIWLRSIFFNEKAQRIPSFLLPLARKLEIYFLKKINLLLANGHDISEYYKKFNLNVHVIKNGVDIHKWSSTPLFENNKIQIAFIGRLAKAKGIEEFLKYVQKMKQSEWAKEFDFTVIGEGPYSINVKKLAQDKLLNYLGAISNQELPRLMKSFDICVALTLAKDIGGGGGTSNALLEQMACGKVILAWDNAIFKQILSRSNAYLSEEGDINGLFNNTLEVLRNKEKAKVLAAQGRELVSEFSIEKQMELFYQTLNHHL